MGSDILLLVLPGALFLCFFMPFGITPNRSLFSQRSGPYVSGEALGQLTLLFLLYIILFLVPIAGKIVGGYGHVAALGTLFVVFMSLFFRFKKIGDE